MRRFQCLLFIVLLSILTAGCSSSVESKSPNGSHTFSGEELIVFAASHLTEAFKDMEKAFEKKTGADVAISFAGTQVLRTQIVHGKPADVFASANLSHMKAVKKQGFVDHYETFAYNTLALIIPKKNPANLKAFKDLAQKDYRLVVGVGNVPIGIYTREVLENASQAYGQGFKRKVLDNVVSLEPNVKKIASKVMLGEADAGFIYATGLVPEVRKKAMTIDIPETFNVKTTDTIAVVNNGDHPELARKWIEFVMSEEGRRILETHQLVTMKGKNQ